jgi:hypothetical protein
MIFLFFGTKKPKIDFGLALDINCFVVILVNLTTNQIHKS